MATTQSECKAMQQQDMNRIPAELGGDLYLCNGSFTKLQDAGAFAKSNESEENSNE